MNRIAATLFSFALLLPLQSIAGEGMITVPSMHATRATMDRLESLAAARGLKVFARIDHAAGAASIGQTLRPTELLIFGHPKGGTPLLQCAQSYGIDLHAARACLGRCRGQALAGLPGSRLARARTPRCRLR